MLRLARWGLAVLWNSLPVAFDMKRLSNPGQCIRYSLMVRTVRKRYTQPEAMYAKVQCISDVLIATQYDWCWHETAHGNAAAAAHSLECIR